MKQIFNNNINRDVNAAEKWNESDDNENDEDDDDGNNRVMAIIRNIQIN